MKKITLYLLLSIFLFSCKKNVPTKVVEKHLVKVSVGLAPSPSDVAFVQRTSLEVGYNQDFSKLIYYSVPNITSKGIEYDINNRITKILKEQVLYSGNPYSGVNTTNLIETNFVYDNTGRITKIFSIVNNSTNSTSFKYDNIGRLITVANFDSRVEYQYVGSNQLPSSFEYFIGNISFWQRKIKFSDKPSPYTSMHGLEFSLGYYFDKLILEDGTDYIYDGDYLIKTYNKNSGEAVLYEYQ